MIKNNLWFITGSLSPDKIFGGKTKDNKKIQGWGPTYSDPTTMMFDTLTIRQHGKASLCPPVNHTFACGFWLHTPICDVNLLSSNPRN